jgi:hypothetical protein
VHIIPSLLDLPLGQESIPTLDFNATSQQYTSYQTNASLTTSVGRRGSLGVGFSRASHDSQSLGQDQTTRSGNVAYTHQVAKGLGARLGYGYTEGRYPSAAQSRTVGSHNLDVGVDFNRALSFSRRTTFSFGTGSSAITDTETTHYRVIGNAQLRHDIGRTWNAALTYSRDLQFVEGFGAPLFSDSLVAGFAGLFHRRVQFTSALGGSFGSAGTATLANDYDTYFATAGLNYAVSRYLNLGIVAFHYRHHFDYLVLLPPGMPPDLARNGLRAYLTLWAPLVHRARRPDAPR